MSTKEFKRSLVMKNKATNKKKKPRKESNDPVSKCTCREPLYVKFGPPREIPVRISECLNEHLAKINDPCWKSPEDTCGSILKLTPPHKNHLRSPKKESTYITSSVNKIEKSSSLVYSDEPSRQASHIEEPQEIQGRHYGRSHSSVYGLTFGEPLKIYNYGERGSGTKTIGPPQDFYALRAHHLENQTLFEDPEFPADNSSLFFKEEGDKFCEWKRPKEIVDNPKLFVDGFSRFDIIQGKLGDCWLSAAAVNLTLQENLFSRVVPDDQCFELHYAGIFHFRFWHYGRWIDVVVDDQLPTLDGQLIYFHSSEKHEFWSALLEKAYAKLYGCYESLKGGSTCEAMEDFTGGLVEIHRVKTADPKELFQIFLKAYERSSLLGASLEPDPDPQADYPVTPEGLLRGHAYSITAVKTITNEDPSDIGIQTFNLLRLRNPWGNQPEWTGAWSDRSEEWKALPDSIKEDMSLIFENDGEFWMSFNDFQDNFDRVEICNMNPDSLQEHEVTNDHKKKWQMSVFEGQWVKGITAGGCRNNPETFWLNPQYRIALEETDENDDENKCTVIIALMQKTRRKKKILGQSSLNIGFVVYQLYNPEKLPSPLDYNFFQYNPVIAKTPSYINMREVTGRFKLQPGNYCIVPSTFRPDEEGEFLIRVFSEHPNNMVENDQNISMTSMARLQPIREEAVEEEDAEEDVQRSSKAMDMYWEIVGEDDDINWVQLKDIFDETMTPFHVSEFSKDTCRSMIAMFDYDRNGKMSCDEFKQLCSAMKRWRKVFEAYDVTRSGSLSNNQLRQAFQAVGYNLNCRILNLLVHRYGNEDQEITFDDFITCATKLKSTMDLFDDTKNENDMICLGLEQWLERTLYN